MARGKAEAPTHPATPGSTGAGYQAGPLRGRGSARSRAAFVFLAIPLAGQRCLGGSLASPLHGAGRARPAHRPLRGEALLSELDAIGRELAAAVGLGGRSRKAGSAVERARQSVTKALRAAIRRIAESDAELGTYLDVTVRTGTACRFDPDLREPVEWRVER